LVAREISLVEISSSRDYRKTGTPNRWLNWRAGWKSWEDLIGLLDGLRMRNRFGGLLGPAVNASAAIGANNLGILVSHLVQEGGKRLAARVA
jgi:hypothetical protein